MSDIRTAWRKRLADRLRRFRRIRHRNPDVRIIEAAKRGIDQAVRLGVYPPQEH